MTLGGDNDDFFKKKLKKSTLKQLTLAAYRSTLKQ